MSYKHPIAGIKIAAPRTSPKPGEVLIGYDLEAFDGDTCFAGTAHCAPRPTKMNSRGWFGTLAMAFVCFPLTCVPCFMSCSYDDRVMRPVYGDPLKSA